MSESLDPSLWEFRWRWVPGQDACRDDDLMSACADLFNAHYGRWGPQGPRPGEQIRIAPRQLADLLDYQEAWLACAFVGERLVGYCASLHTDIPGRGRVSWVTQLVVDEAYRRQRVATRLLYGNWQFSDFHAWGLTTANPLAVRALETATRRVCRRRHVSTEGAELIAHLAEKVPYLPRTLVRDHEKIQPKVNTNFHVDLRGLPRMRDQAARRERPWDLGSIGPGEEWFACTFSSQPPARLGSHRLRELLMGSDEIWIQAYERMTLNEEHRWYQHAEDEVDYIIEACELADGAAILDVGCGDGRHARSFARRGFEVTAVDISPRLANRARQLAENHPQTLRFDVMDAREELPDGPFDLVVCLYDVLGSSANPHHDGRIVRNIRNRMRSGGHAVTSVMNSATTMSRLPDDHAPTDEQAFISALESLAPSTTMESSGDIFDPELVVVYDGVHYRKEQFEQPGWHLPAELVVRDRRYTPDELTQTLRNGGLHPTAVIPVQSGAWRRHPPLEATDPRAKELLTFASRP